jgi:membrane protease YdiL (CAAX protease family)
MTPVHWFAFSIFAVAAAASSYGWFAIVRKMRRGREPLPFELRSPITWTGAEALLVIAAYMSCGFMGAAAAKSWYDREQAAGAAPVAAPAAPEPVAPELATPAPADAVADPARFLLRQLQGKVVADIGFLIVAALIFRFVRPTPREHIGLSTRPLVDLRTGIAGFLIIVPPVLLLSVVLAKFWKKSEHPVLVGLQQTPDAPLWFWAAVAVVGTAPLVEEFLFRGVIQNWLNRAWSFAADSIELPGGEVVPPSRSAAAFAHDGPVVATAGLFALMHLGHGPDPIPLFFLALGLGYLFRQTNRIWPGWIVHSLLNAFSLSVLPLEF